jgi:hypothetical protein
MLRPAALLCRLGVLLAALPADAAADVPYWLAGELSLSTGFDYREGKYGDPVRSEIAYVPFTVGYLFDELALTSYPLDQVELKVSVPWLSVRGPANPDQGFIGSGDARDFSQDTRRGIGDVLLRGSYIWFPPLDSRLPAVELSAKVKFPTADEQDNLGTGEPAYTFQADLYQRVGRLTPIATVGYRIVEPAEGFDLRDSAYTSVGASYRLAESTSVGLLYDWWQSSSRNRGDAHELFPYATYRLTPWLRLTPYGVFGLSRDATDWGLGLQLRAAVRID